MNASKWRPKAIFSDVDGTILDSSHRVSACMAETSRELAEAGIPLVLVSARMPKALYGIRKELVQMGPAICYSGALVLDGSGSVLLSRTIPLDYAKEVHGYIAQSMPALTCMAYGFDEWVVADRHDPHVMHEEHVVGVEAAEGTLEEHFSERGLHKFLLVGEPQEIERAEHEIDQRFSGITAVRSSSVLCEIMDSRASKAEGIQAVLDHLGLDVRDALAIGDGRNDIDMLRAVPESWAMANAPEQVKAAAAHVTSSDNNHDGCAKTIRLSAIVK